MAIGFLNISHNFAGETQFIICEWVKSTAQGTPVVGHVTGTGLGAQNDTDATEVFYPAPHSNRQLQVINLPEVWHLVRFWRSSDGVSKDVLLLELAGNARTGATYPITRYEYVVDRGQSDPGVWADPVQDDTGIGDTRLAGQTYWVEERGTGSLLTTEIVDRPAGGFDFAEVGKVMNSGGVYVVYAITRIDLTGDDSGVVGGDEGAVFILSTDQDYNPVTMGGRTLISNFATTIGTLTMPNLLLVADSRFILQTHGGSQRNVVIQFDAGDTIRFMGADVNKLILGGSEEIEILIKDNVAYVLAHSTNHNRLGQVLWSYKNLINTLLADGSLLVLADYPRVQELMNSLPASSVVSEVTWQTSSTEDGQTVYANKGKWMSDGTNFRTPDLRGRMFKALSALDGSVASGRYEHQKVLQHNHFISGGTDNDDVNKTYLAEAHSTGGNAGYDLYGSSVAPIQYRTGDPRVNNAASVNTEQKINNIGLYPLICI